MNAMNSLLRKSLHLMRSRDCDRVRGICDLPGKPFCKQSASGDQYYSYYLAYVPALFALFCLYATRAGSFEKLGWSLVFGVAAGYAAGLAAYVVVVFAMGDGLARITNSVRDVKSFLLYSQHHFSI